MDMNEEREVVTQEIKRLIRNPRLVHFSIRDEIITNFDDYMHYVKKDGRVVCVNINTLERTDLEQGENFKNLFGIQKVDAS